ncbi:MAG: ABC transporter permease subunit [Acidobacteriota bacterium]
MDSATTHPDASPQASPPTGAHPTALSAPPTTDSSRQRILAVARQELATRRMRPMLWIVVALFALISYGLSTGSVRVASGDASVGGTQAYITSEFATTFVLTLTGFLTYLFFVSIAAGMLLREDRELKVSEILHSTPLRPQEYVWGKALGLIAAFLVVMAVHMASMIFFNHVLPSPTEADIRGPFQLISYLRPMVVILLPPLLFFTGACLWIAERFRRPMLAFALPLVVTLAELFFFWAWNPSWLDPRVDRLLMLIDPSGFRWINGTYLQIDRGVEFYNNAALSIDGDFALSRLAYAVVGIGAIALTGRYLESSLRGTPAPKQKRSRKRPSREAAAAAAADTQRRPASLGTLPSAAQLTPSFRSAWLTIARSEGRELVRSPALWLFFILVVIQILGNAFSSLGAFETDLLFTPGQLALNALGPITVCTSLLLMFFAVESLHRDRAAGAEQIVHATPIPTSALVLGKLGIHGITIAVIYLAAFLGCAAALMIQGQVPLALGPFLLLWGGVITPTLLLVLAFLAAAYAISGSRFVPYALTLGALVYSGYLSAIGEMSWLGNWFALRALSWSDIGPLELHSDALWLNRLFVLALAFFLFAVAVRFYGRRQGDATRSIHRLAPARLRRSALSLLPWALPALILGTMLYLRVEAGPGGGQRADDLKDYWKGNYATWIDRPIPALTTVDAAVDLWPDERRFAVEGTYTFLHDGEGPLRQLPLTRGLHWELEAQDGEFDGVLEPVSTSPGGTVGDLLTTGHPFRLDGQPIEPDDRSGLLVFELPQPLQPGESLTLSFRYGGQFPDGISFNGGPQMEFILPSSVVLTSFSPSVLPVPGFIDGLGVDDDNRLEPVDFPPDYHLQELPPALGSATQTDVRLAITVPDDGMRAHGVGKLVSEEASDGRRTFTWASDQPVRFFNIVAGYWKEAQGDHSTIYHHASHDHNVEEMVRVLDGARTHYSRWFHPYPWEDLRLNEFAANAGYAQGFPTNITFSEGIGFLTESDAETNAAFLVTAHEAAHQWWGNLLIPGDGPGGVVIAEGMAHYSTLLLFEEMLGEQHRMGFARRIEGRYGDGRRRDSERPLNRVDGQRPGDTTVIYDKGGWAAWMLMQQMGREPMLAGLQELFQTYRNGPDHPLLEDMLATLRQHAEDPEAFDQIAQQLYFDTVVPEYRVRDAEVEAQGQGYRLTFEVENIGTGRFPLEIAAVAGVRFPAEEGQSNAQSEGQSNTEPYREQRVQATLGAGETQRFEMLLPFEPQEVVVDPDVHILQLRREQALARL